MTDIQTTPPPPAGAAILPRPPWRVGESDWDFRSPLIMGVLNATPDSFSDGGEFLSVDSALLRAGQLLREGADLIDLGGASSHPLAAPVAPAVELGRIREIVERLVAEVPLPLSIDTQRPEVAEVCLGLGAHLINDVSGLPGPAMARVAARYDVPLVVMYNNLTHPRAPGHASLLAAMREFFQQRVALAEAEGVSRLILDPGYGFGKTLAENLEVVRELSGLRALGRPLLVCTSRKGSLGRITGEKNPKQRLAATLASTLFAVEQGAAMVRVHDVRPLHQALRTWMAIRGPGE